MPDMTEEITKLLPCASCGSIPTERCGARVGLLRRCGERICRQCCHYGQTHQSRIAVVEMQAAELDEDIAALESKYEALKAAGTAVNNTGERYESLKERRRQRKEMEEARADLIALHREFEEGR